MPRLSWLAAHPARRFQHMLPGALPYQRISLHTALSATPSSTAIMKPELRIVAFDLSMINNPSCPMSTLQVDAFLPTRYPRFKDSGRVHANDVSFSGPAAANYKPRSIRTSCCRPLVDNRVSLAAHRPREADRDHTQQSTLQTVQSCLNHPGWYRNYHSSHGSA